MATPQPPQTTQTADGELRLFAQASFPEIYEQALVGPLFRPWAGPLLDEVELRPGDRVLDLACGTGVVARVAKERLGPAGRVVGIDLNPQMLAVARRVAPEIEWREGNAASLPLNQGERFDVVVCQQGFQFFPDIDAAAREVRRALESGGRVGISTWRPDEEFATLRQLRAIAERHVGPVDDRRHSLGDPAPVEAALEDAGFRDIRSRRLSRTIRFTDGAVFARLNAMAMVSMSARGGALDDEARTRTVDAIVRDSGDLVRDHTDAEGFAFELATNLVVARG